MQLESSLLLSLSMIAPAHYLGSPRTMLGVGEAFGEAVLELEALAKEIREEDAADAAPDL